MHESPKMATAAVTKSQEMETEPGHVGELATIMERLDILEGGLVEKLNCLLRSITQSLDNLAGNIQKATQKAEEALTISLKHTDKTTRLQEQSDKTFEQMVILNNKSRFFNLKLSGQAENVENSTDLISYVTDWLISSLKVGEVLLPMLSQAYRIGRANNPTRPFPRDIIITFISVSVKKWVFDYAKENDGILNHKDKIQVFLDLAPEALAKCKELKEIIAILRDVHI